MVSTRRRIVRSAFMIWRWRRPRVTGNRWAWFDRYCLRLLLMVAIIFRCSGRFLTVGFFSYFFL